MSAHTDGLLAGIASHVAINGDNYIQKIDKETYLLRLWLQYLSSYEVTGCANVLLSGVSSAVIEVAACLTVGFARTALSPMRSQIDLVLSWLYFKDHPIEWDRLEQHGDGFMLKTELLKYLSEKYLISFGARLAVLKQAKCRPVDDPYSLLSAHLHKQSSGTVVSVDSCAQIICSEKDCSDAVVLQASTTEYLGDILLACYADKWAAIPTEIINAARSRLTKAQEVVLFS